LDDPCLSLVSAKVFTSFSFSGTQYEYFKDPELASKLPDQFDAIYKDVPKKHQVLRKVKNCEFCYDK
jgi:hypothetical protein